MLGGALGRTDRTGQPRLISHTPGYRLEVAADDLDKLVFERLTEQARQAAGYGDLTSSADLLERALALWRGRLLDGMDLGAAADSESADLTERHLTALEDWADARLALGQHLDVLPALTR